jgi:hypothetical protein
MISTIGSDRVMMGADLRSNVLVEFAKYRALDLEPPSMTSLWELQQLKYST